MDAFLSVDSLVIASSQQVSCPLGEESAILSMKNSVYYGMDAVGTRVWNLLKRPTRVAELRDALLEEYDVDRELCERDLMRLLQQMHDEGLIEIVGASAP